MNWMRENWSPSTCPSVLTASVLARPGTPSTRRWPRQSRATIIRSTSERWPTMTFLHLGHRGLDLERLLADRLVQPADVDLGLGHRSKDPPSRRPKLLCERVPSSLVNVPLRGPLSSETHRANMGSREGCSLERMAAGRRAPGAGAGARLGPGHSRRCGLHGQPGHHLEAAARRRSLLGRPRPRRLGLDGRARAPWVGPPVGPSPIPSPGIASPLQVGPPGTGPTAAERARLRLGLWLGKIDSAYEVYAGGRAWAAWARCPPRRASTTTGTASTRSRPTASTPTGAWSSRCASGRTPSPRRGIAGAHGRAPSPRPPGAPGRRRQHGRVPELVLAALFVMVGLYHLHLFRRRHRPPGVPLVRAAVAGLRAYTLCRRSGSTSYRHFPSLHEGGRTRACSTCFAAGLVAVPLAVPVAAHPGGAARVFQAVSLAAGCRGSGPGLYLNLRLLPWWECGALALGVLAFTRSRARGLARPSRGPHHRAGPGGADRLLHQRHRPGARLDLSRRR